MIRKLIPVILALVAFLGGAAAGDMLKGGGTKEAAHDEAWRALGNNRDILDALVLELLEKETLEAERLAEIFANVRKEPKRDVWLSSADRHVSTRGPVMTPAEERALAAGKNIDDNEPKDEVTLYPPQPPAGPGTQGPTDTDPGLG